MSLMSFSGKNRELADSVLWTWLWTWSGVIVTLRIGSLSCGRSSVKR